MQLKYPSKTRVDLDQIFQKPRLDESCRDWVTSLDKLERIQESQYWWLGSLDLTSLVKTEWQVWTSWKGFRRRKARICVFLLTRRSSLLKRLLSNLQPWLTHSLQNESPWVQVSPKASHQWFTVSMAMYVPAWSKASYVYSGTDAVLVARPSMYTSIIQTDVSPVFFSLM